MITSKMKLSDAILKVMKDSRIGLTSEAIHRKLIIAGYELKMLYPDACIRATLKRSKKFRSLESYRGGNFPGGGMVGRLGEYRKIASTAILLASMATSSLASTYGTFTVQAKPTTITNEVTKQSIVFTAQCTYTIWPDLVYIRSHDLIIPPLPKCNVRTFGKCVDTNAAYFDIWDGDVNPMDGTRRTIRVYYDKVDCTTFTVGATYLVDGLSSQQGRLTASKVTRVGG